MARAGRHPTPGGELTQSMPSGEMNAVKHRVLQANPRRYRLFGAIRDGYELSSWTVAQFREEIAPGDKFALWVSGEERGVYALGVVTKHAEYRQDNDPYWVDLTEAYTR